MLDLQRELSGSTRVFVSSDRGNKKGLHHLVKVLSWWSKKDGTVKRIMLDTDAFGGRSNKTSDGINLSLCKLDTVAKN